MTYIALFDEYGRRWVPGGEAQRLSGYSRGGLNNLTKLGRVMQRDFDGVIGSRPRNPGL